MTNENESKPEVNNPLKDNQSIDLSGIMNIAGSLLENPKVLDTVSEVNNPLKDNQSIDLSGIMNIAGSLLENPEVLDTVSEVNNPLKDNQSIDLSGIMNIAGSLLKNPEVLNTVSDVMKLTNSVHDTSNKPEELQVNTILALQKQIAEMNQQIIDLQNQIKNNEELKDIIVKIIIKKRR
jgi:hypothetical protein